jgi:hypothetical protein
MNEIETHNIPAMPNSYKLSEDSIRALTDLVNKRFDKLISDTVFDDKIMKKYQARLDEYMMKQYPDLSNRLNSLALKLDDHEKSLEKSLKDVMKREKNLIKSESVYEDIYKLRDEFKEIKKFVDEFQKKMKKVFEL